MAFNVYWIEKYFVLCLWKFFNIFTVPAHFLQVIAYAQVSLA